MGSVGQRVVKLQPVKVGGLKSILPLRQSQTKMWVAVKNFIGMTSSLTVLSIDNAKVRSERTLLPRILFLKFCSNGSLRSDRRNQKTHGSAQLRTLVSIMDYNLQKC